MSQEIQMVALGSCDFTTVATRSEGKFLPNLAVWIEMILPEFGSS